MSNTKEQIKGLIPKEKFLKCNAWERKFIASVMQYDKLSDKQMKTIRDISKKYQVKDVKLRTEDILKNLYT